MDSAITAIQKMKPVFERATRNTYINATKDTFITLIYFVVATSIMGLFADAFLYFDIWHSAIDYMHAVNILIYGNLGLICAVVAPRYLTVHLNAELASSHKLDANLLTISCVVCFIIFTNQLTGLFELSSYGTEQVILALITAFGTGGISSAIVSHLSFDLPEGYPPNVEHYTKEVLAILGCIACAIFINVLCLIILDLTFALLVLRIIIPIFRLFNTVWGLAFIAGFMALIWFSGVHDSSVVDPFIMGAALYYSAQNYAMVQIGSEAVGLLTPTTRYFIMALGGTGATLVPCLMFKYLSKHKQLREIGSSAWRPVFCGVNEPILYGVPLVQNPNFLIPFIAAPVANTLVYSFFVLHLNMGGFAYVLPWFTPAPIGIILCASLNPLSLGLLASLTIIDFLIYLPFFKKFDDEYIEEESAIRNETLEISDINNLQDKKILILCAGGGTSGIVAQRMQKDASDRDINVKVDAGAYGSHSDLLSNYDLIMLAPQVLSYLPALKHETEELHVTCSAFDANQYMSVLENPAKGLKVCSKCLSE